MYFFVFGLIICFFWSFRKKVLILLMLEFFMLIFIYSYFFFNGPSFILVMFCLSLFMVLDSVFGLSCLIFSSRNSSSSSSLYCYF